MNDFDTINMNKAQKAIYYLREYGWAYTKNRALKKLGIPVPEETEYRNWLRKHTATAGELKRQHEEKLPYMPTIDIVTDETDKHPAGSTKMQLSMSANQSALMKSVKKQSYPAVGQVYVLKENAAAENACEGEKQNSLEKLLEKLSGEIIVFAAADTILAPELFYEYAKLFGENEKAELIYTDEDCGSADGKHRSNPYFKPDISPELLCCFQYIGGVFAVRRSTLERLPKRGESSIKSVSEPENTSENLSNAVSGSEPEILQKDAQPLEKNHEAFTLKLNGNGWYDLIFQLAEMLMEEEKQKQKKACQKSEKPEQVIEKSEKNAGGLPADNLYDDISVVHPVSIAHISKVLFTKVAGEKFEGFYRRLDDQSEYIRRHLVRCGIKGEVQKTTVPGFYHVRYAMENTPLVSILIPTKDHTDDLDTCIQSIIRHNDYRNFEIVIIENNSEKPETFAYYENLLGTSYDANNVCTGTLPEGQCVKVTTWQGEFNYSGINNFGVKAAEGEYLLFLNNDTEFMEENAITELVERCQADGVGGSGAMLYYADGTIQHGGVVYKIGGFAANALWSLTDRDEKYYPYSVTAREMSCVTAACLLLKREAFEAAGGFDETLCVALNDVDLCLKVRKAGYKLIFDPFAKLHHYESKSRGMETTPEKQERFNREIAYFQEKWQRELDLGDPYYNVNQTLHYANYALELAEDNRGRYKC